MTAVGDFMVHDPTHIDSFHNISTYLGAWMGSITATGSVIAYGKLAGSINSNALQLAYRDTLNVGLAGASAAGLLGFMVSSDPTVSAVCLATGVASSGALGNDHYSSCGSE